MKMTWNIMSFIFCMTFNFSKCDGFTVLLIISFTQCGKSIASPLQPWQFDTKITSENKISYLNEGWLFVGRVKVGSLPKTKNKEVLA